MEFFFGVFDNDKDRSLIYLNKEEEKINQAFRGLMNRLKKKEQLDKELRCNQKFADFVDQLSDFKERMTIFHFSGHHEKEDIQKSDISVNEDKLVRILNTCEKLKLVFLNGCKTVEMGRKLINVPIVISTNEKVKDDLAQEVATRFYEELCKGNDIELFRDAASLKTVFDKTINFQNLAEESSQNRGVFKRSVKAQKEIREIYNIDVNVNLPYFEEKMKGGEQVNNEGEASTFSANEAFENLIEHWVEDNNLTPFEKIEHKGNFYSLFPKPIAHFLRKIDPNQDFKIEKSMGNTRFEVLQNLFFSMLTFLKFCSFCMIWEEKSNNSLSLDDKMKSDILTHLEFGWMDRSTKVDTKKTDEEIDLLMELYQKLKEKTVQNEFVIDTFQLLNNEKKQLQDFGKLFSIKSKKAASNHFREAELFLKFFVENCTFLKKYELMSVLNPSFTKYKIEEQEAYNYTVRFYPKGRNKGKTTDLQTKTKIYDTYSILLKNKNDINALINLSPFYIDKIRGSSGADNIELTCLYNYGLDEGLIAYYNLNDREIELEIWHRLDSDKELVASKDIYERVKIYDHINNFIETIKQ